MKKAIVVFLFLLSAIFIAESVLAQELIIFPAKGQNQEQMENEYAAKRNTYNRAYSACLEGKGYTVK